jgi:hypothetical protein
MRLHRFALAALVVELALGGCASAGDMSGGGGPGIAGLYSTAHRVTIDGDMITTAGYLLIAADGKVTVYTHRSATPDSPKRDCYAPAKDTETDGPLQGRFLNPGKAPTGEPDYEVTVNGVAFGILADGARGEPVRWFVHSYRANNTVNVHGLQDVVNISGQTYSISGSPLPSAVLDTVRSKPCDASPGSR